MFFMGRGNSKRLEGLVGVALAVAAVTVAMLGAVVVAMVVVW
jgi:hypothetical protein